MVTGCGGAPCPAAGQRLPPARPPGAAAGEETRETPLPPRLRPAAGKTLVASLFLEGEGIFCIISDSILYVT